MVEHIDPNLSIADDFCNESFFNYLPGSGGEDRNAALFQVIFHAIPSQLQCVFQTLSGTFLFQWREVLLTIRKGFAQKVKSAIKIFKSLSPADILIHKVRKI